MSTITSDQRDEFEKVFPIPSHVIRCGKGYACTEYNAWGGHDFIRKWEGWSAAMLQSFGNSEQLNSPVIPDGWVACSERMPIENDIVLVVDDGYFVCEAQYREGDFFSVVRGKGEFFETTCRDVELWMPLPAAPKPEVK